MKRTILKVLLVLTMLAAVLTMCSALARTSGTHVAAAAPKPLTPAATAWPCSKNPPLAPPAYPGDGGPAS